MKLAYALETWANNQILRSVAKPVEKITKEIKTFGKILLDKMYEYEGVWLAAPQIWVSQRIIAVSFRKEKGEKTICLGDTVMVNPVIIQKSDEKYLFEEACLSLPKKRGDVLRHRHITVSYQTLDGKKHIKKLSNMSAVIIQHEIDHLDGILFIDKIVA